MATFHYSLYVSWDCWITRHRARRAHGYWLPARPSYCISAFLVLAYQLESQPPTDIIHCTCTLSALIDTFNLRFTTSVFTQNHNFTLPSHNLLQKWLVTQSNSIIIIIKRDWQCKAGRERLTPYQSEDPNPTTPTLERNKRKGKTVGDKKWASS